MGFIRMATLDEIDYQRFRSSIIESVTIFSSENSGYREYENNAQTVKGNTFSELSPEAQRHAQLQMREAYVEQLYKHTPPQQRAWLQERALQGDIEFRVSPADEFQSINGKGAVAGYAKASEGYVAHPLSARFDQHGNIQSIDPLLGRRANHETAHLYDLRDAVGRQGGFSSRAEWSAARHQDAAHINIVDEIARNTQMSPDGALSVNQRGYTRADLAYEAYAQNNAEAPPTLRAYLQAQTGQDLGPDYLTAYMERLQGAYEDVKRVQGNDFLPTLQNDIEQNVKYRVTDFGPGYYEVKGNSLATEAQRNREAFAKFSDAESVNFDPHGVNRASGGRNPIVGMLMPHMQEHYHEQVLPELGRQAESYRLQNRAQGIKPPTELSTEELMNRIQSQDERAPTGRMPSQGRDISGVAVAAEEHGQWQAYQSSKGDVMRMNVNERFSSAEVAQAWLERNGLDSKGAYAAQARDGQTYIYTPQSQANGAMRAVNQAMHVHENLHRSPIEQRSNLVEAEVSKWQPYQSSMGSVQRLDVTQEIGNNPDAVNSWLQERGLQQQGAYAATARDGKTYIYMPDDGQHDVAMMQARQAIVRQNTVGMMHNSWEAYNSASIGETVQRMDVSAIFQDTVEAERFTRSVLGEQQGVHVASKGGKVFLYVSEGDVEARTQLSTALVDQHMNNRTASNGYRPRALDVDATLSGDISLKQLLDMDQRANGLDSVQPTRAPAMDIDGARAPTADPTPIHPASHAPASHANVRANTAGAGIGLAMGALGIAQREQRDSAEYVVATGANVAGIAVDVATAAGRQGLTKAALPLAAVATAADMTQAIQDGDYRRASGLAGGFMGGVAGGIGAGMASGALVGSSLGPVGTVAVGFAGGIVGGVLGEQAMLEMFDAVERGMNRSGPMHSEESRAMVSSLLMFAKAEEAGLYISDYLDSRTTEYLTLVKEDILPLLERQQQGEELTQQEQFRLDKSMEMALNGLEGVIRHDAQLHQGDREKAMHDMLAELVSATQKAQEDAGLELITQESNEVSPLEEEPPMVVTSAVVQQHVTEHKEQPGQDTLQLPPDIIQQLGEISTKMQASGVTQNNDEGYAAAPMTAADRAHAVGGRG